MGNKSDLRDPKKTDSQVSQERAVSFSKAHGMIFFETSAKDPPKKGTSGQEGSRQALYQQDNVEDIVTAVSLRLKRQKKLPTANSLAYSGSFKLANKKKAEKEPTTCC